MRFFPVRFFPMCFFPVRFFSVTDNMTYNVLLQLYDTTLTEICKSVNILTYSSQLVTMYISLCERSILKEAFDENNYCSK